MRVSLHFDRPQAERPYLFELEAEMAELRSTGLLQHASAKLGQT